MASNLKDLQTEAFSLVASIRTLLDGYPNLLKDIPLDISTSNSIAMDYLYKFMTVIGVSNEQIIDKISDLLTGNGEQGVLDVIENYCKNILLTNIKSTMGCSIEPIIPDELFDEYKNSFDETIIGHGISVPISTIDFMGVLKVCPTSENGKNHYFDAYDSNYYPSTLWKSRDIDAFIWYTINKGVNGSNKLIWDNRNSISKEDWINNKEDFLLSGYTVNNIVKKNIAKFSYSENYGISNEQLTLRICSDNYYKKRSIEDYIKLDEFGLPTTKILNKTIFEFNYDYIHSIKLFDSKVLVANIVNNLINGYTSNSIVSYNELIVKAQMRKMIKNIIDSDEEGANDCFYIFSNDEYNALLSEAEKQRLEYNNFVYNSSSKINVNDILDNLSGITSNSSIQSIKDTIKTTITNITEEATNDNLNSVEKNNTKINIINQLLNEICSSITLAILSPRVMLLLEFNKYVFGVNNKDTVKNSEPGEYFINEIMGTTRGLIISIIKKIVSVVMDYFYRFAVEQYKLMLDAFIIDILLEKIQIFRRLLERLYKDYKLWLGSGGASNASNNGIDNVDYADILNQQTIPITTIC